LGFTLDPGETLGIVGDSGCGKSMTALALMGLLPEAAQAAGRIRFEDRDLLALPEAELCRLRGHRLAMVFQEPMTSLNPLHTIGDQIAEPLRLHLGHDPAAAAREALRLLTRVGLPEPERRLRAYPHQLSGGQRQRAMIAMALACRPALLIADEPTTALDVTIQGQILDLMIELVEETGMALILISHDLGVIAETVDRVMVMYGGVAVETAPVAELLARPAHPYTRGLLAALPRRALAHGGRLQPIPGTVPDIAALPAGCTFAGRCRFVVDACRSAPPPAAPVGTDHHAACIRLDTVRAEAMP
ncbi:MAG: ABC transporter ATP-binding protein, partial [Proteobacteria bacterium]|nr:ABC transporter ATP-binding protein [Pseudomonadota bacterium]